MKYHKKNTRKQIFYGCSFKQLVAESKGVPYSKTQ